ncbi:hypothetical protein [Castellaniella sp.]|uniref:hypothetical protein n=1 Tax=Castellaniella sp. TaxID=1955812 RepID=UPI00356167CF
MANKILFKTRIGTPGIEIAQALQSGNLLLFNGLGGFASGAMVPEPLHGSASALQMRQLFSACNSVLESASDQAFRVFVSEQRFAAARTVPVMHRYRRESWQPVPPSTSVLLPSQGPGSSCIQLDALAGAADAVEYLDIKAIDIPSTSGFVPAASFGKTLFSVAGFMAAHGKGDLGGISPEVMLPAGHQWKGNRIQREVDYIWRQKLQPILQELGLGVDTISKATIFYTEPEDLGDVVEAWNDLHSGTPPMTHFISVRHEGLAIFDARVEINLYMDAERSARALPAGCPNDGMSQAARFGEHLILLIYPDPAPESDQACFSQTEFEAWNMAEKLKAVLDEWGVGFDAVARLAQFMRQPDDILQSCRIWEKYFGPNPIPLSLWACDHLPHRSIGSYGEVWVKCP